MKNYVIKKEKNTEGIQLISEKNVSIILLKVENSNYLHQISLPYLHLKFIYFIFLRKLLV